MRDFEKIHRFMNGEYYNIDTDLKNLIIVLEDRRFYHHPGFDFRSLLRAFFWYAILKPRGGGSTIDMQLIRLITGRYERTLSRKLKEIILSLWLRKYYEPSKIISTYLNIAYTGYNSTGVEAASFSLFYKPLHMCSIREKSIIASVLISPIPKFKSLDWWSRVIRRGNYARKLANL